MRNVAPTAASGRHSLTLAATAHAFRIRFRGTQQDCPVPLNHPVFFVSLNEAGSSVIDIDGLRLDLVFLNDQGEKRDWFSIVKE